MAPESPRACAFCGRAADSREHLFPDWLRKVLPSEEQMLHFRQVGKEGATMHEWSSRPFVDKVRFVCSRCNTGWMSLLEQQAQPLLRPPITRTPCVFTTPQRIVLASWAAKTSLVFQASQTDEPLAPHAHFAHLRQHQSPPHQVTVWLGSHFRTRQDAANSVFVQRPLSLESDDERIDEAQANASGFGYLNFLAVGAVFFLLVGHRFANRMNVEYQGHLAEGLIRIWPNSAPVVAWPPKYMMDRDLLEGITLPPSGLAATIRPPGESGV